MAVYVRELEERDLPAAVRIWNQVIEDGIAFPQLEILTVDTGRELFAQQSFSGVACTPEGEVVGLYTLHPNNVGRCGHLCNASYAVDRDRRGEHIGEALVRHCLEKGTELGFRVLQFNAVVASNTAALALYRKLGFVQLGTITGGFLMKDGHYEDIILHYHLL